MIIKPIHIRYKEKSFLDTSIFGLSRHGLLGSDSALYFGNFMNLQNKINLYSIHYPGSKHILASLNPIDWRKPIINEELNCLYSRYFSKEPNKSIVCRYIPNYFKVISWVTDEVHFNIESIISNSLNSLRMEFGYGDRIAEDYFIMDSFMEPFEMVDTEFLIDKTAQFYKIQNGMFHPFMFGDSKKLKEFINSRRFTLKTSEDGDDVSDKTHPNDCECMNRILHMPINKLVCIYYPKKDDIEINFAQLETGTDIKDIVPDLKTICKLYSNDTEKVTLNIENEEIFIETDKGIHYINIPTLDLINQLIEVN